MRKAFATENSALWVYGSSGGLAAFLNLQSANQIRMHIPMECLGSEVQSSSLLKVKPIKIGFRKLMRPKFQKQ